MTSDSKAKALLRVMNRYLNKNNSGNVSYQPTSLISESAGARSAMELLLPEIAECAECACRRDTSQHEVGAEKSELLGWQSFSNTSPVLGQLFPRMT